MEVVDLKLECAIHMTLKINENHNMFGFGNLKFM